MVSLPNSRTAERWRGFRPGGALRLAVGTVPGVAMLAAAAATAVPAAAQSLPAPTLPAPALTAPGDAADLAPPPPPAPPLPAAEPVAVPLTLDDLIPAEAVRDPEAWAQRGVANPASAPAPLELPAPGELFAEAFAAGLGEDSPGAAPGDFAFDIPAPLPADPELERLAELAEPLIAELPDLAEVRIDNALALGLPIAPEAFPESSEFIARFRALSTIRELDASRDRAPQIAARARADEALLGEILRAYGYYRGDVIRQLAGGRGGDAPAAGGAGETEPAPEPGVRFDVFPGPRYAFGRVDLGGVARLRPEDAARLTAAFGIAPGDPLYADDIIEGELSLKVALGESGYVFAEVAEPSLLIDHARTEGDLALPVAPGGRYAFGAVMSSDPAFLPGDHLARIARFAPGELYQRSLETDLRRAIIATGLVSSVTITPRETAPPVGGQPGELALDVAFDRAPLRTIAAAIGYGTEDGFKLEGRWEHRNLFPPEGALRLRGILGTREQLASIGFRRNNFRGRDQVLTADGFASDITTEAVDARSIGARGTFERVSNFLFQKPFSWLIGGEVLLTEERNRAVRIAPGAPLPRRRFLIAGLFGSATIDESDDLLDPSSGWRGTLFLAPEISRSRGDESAYLRAQADASYYLPVGTTVLAGRLRAATIQGTASDNVAPSRRLYAGGGGSVRGYGFQGIGPRDSAGQPTGGASLIELAAEVRVETGLLGGAVEIVPFLDAGTVGTGALPDFADIRVAAGIGLRYKTSFGPIRIDVAAPLNPGPFDAPVVVFVGLGQAF